MQNIRALDYCQGKCPPTRRALEAGDSAAFLSIIPASSFLCSQAESTFRTLSTNSNCWGMQNMFATFHHHQILGGIS